MDGFTQIAEDMEKLFRCLMDGFTQIAKDMEKLFFKGIYATKP